LAHGVEGVISMQGQSKTARVKVGPNLFQRGERFYLIANVQGRQVCEALKAKDKTSAKVERDRRMAELRTTGLAAVGDRSVTFEQLGQKFLDHEAGPSARLSERTRELRRVTLTKHVYPVLGKTRAVEITSAHVRVLIDKLNRKGLSGSHVRGIVASVSCVLDHGARTNVVHRNVVRDLTRGDLPSAKRQTEPRYLTKDQVEALIARLSVEFAPIAACCFYGGLRISEVLALTWRDVDFDGSRISVRAGKTAASVADVPLLRRLATLLRAHRERQGRQGFARISPEARVFTTCTGRPQSRRNALRAVNVASEHVGLRKDGQERVGCHDLRHSLAANAFALGLSPVEVSKLLRHANPQVTMTVYAGLAGDHVETLSTKLAGMGG
jgi:integrase